MSGRIATRYDYDPTLHYNWLMNVSKHVVAASLDDYCLLIDFCTMDVFILIPKDLRYDVEYTSYLLQKYIAEHRYKLGKQLIKEHKYSTCKDRYLLPIILTEHFKRWLKTLNQ